MRPPVILTTAYENYALEAFQHQGCAYLLKSRNIDDRDIANRGRAPYCITAISAQLAPTLLYYHQPQVRKESIKRDVPTFSFF
ncbi:hypothetical protein [Sphingobacterium paludis]|uniref:Uncharacterized protein n=1 Tax=Sphingobacterium paludis TaxID=1476465 RepID=A0A4R7DB16_9SPHI|nr:hypothetical protein [Sphingobacterium paludis]TDS17315.1 hypothetical protein B0I21_101179 [Sphingobacterium paludis]